MNDHVCVCVLGEEWWIRPTIPNGSNCVVECGMQCADIYSYSTETTCNQKNVTVIWINAETRSEIDKINQELYCMVS